MSWHLASFLILGGALLAGFAWYERSRPPSQVVALVAALAALAIAGRIAFAAFPNVKPTTDIIVFAGYALGGAPGFAVGALAALVSNFWFGQGPWTPWQMAAWGLCGVLGAALALGTRNASRLLLAATCGFAGIFYGALLNFSLMATYGGDLSWRHFWALEAQAVPFDAAHVSANVVLALLAGPAMVRMLTRFRERFEWARGSDPTPAPRRLRPALRGGGIAALLALVLALGALAPSPARASTVTRAAGWLESVQNADGGFGPSAGDESGAATTCWVMLGLEAAARNPLDVVKAGRTPIDFLRKDLGSVHSSGDLARTIVALEGAGVDPRDFGGRNLVAELLAGRRKDGSYHGWPNSTAFAVIALRAAGAGGGVQDSLDWLRKVQNDDGGWGDVEGSPSTSDGTGAVLQALSPDSKASQRGLAYLRDKAQRKGGGFPLGGNGAVNTQSTAWAIQGILATGGDPRSFKRGGASAYEYLVDNQRADGSFRYAKPSSQTPASVANQTPVWVTGEVLVAASFQYFPISAPPRAPKPKQEEPLPKESSEPESGAGVGAPPPSAAAKPPHLGSFLEKAGIGGKGGTGQSPGPGVSKAQATSPSATGSTGVTGTGPAPTETAAGAETSEGTSSSSGSTAGAILLGLLAGCVLFGLGLAARRGWMRWRYGL
jgi:prenyltransferase/squalene oxidase-like repeat protein